MAANRPTARRPSTSLSCPYRKRRCFCSVFISFQRRMANLTSRPTWPSSVIFVFARVLCLPIFAAGLLGDWGGRSGHGPVSLTCLPFLSGRLQLLCLLKMVRSRRRAPTTSEDDDGNDGDGEGDAVDVADGDEGLWRRTTRRSTTPTRLGGGRRSIALPAAQQTRNKSQSQAGC